MDKLVSIELSVAKWNLVMRGVTQLPYAEVAQLVAEIQAQADQKMQETAVEPQSAEVQPS